MIIIAPETTHETMITVVFESDSFSVVGAKEAVGNLEGEADGTSVGTKI